MQDLSCLLQDPAKTNKDRCAITDTHSVGAVVDGYSRLPSLAHPYWNVALWVGESHVDHCKDNTQVGVNMFEQNQDKGNESMVTRH